VASRVRQVIVDCGDPERLAGFWCQVLAYELTRSNPRSAWIVDPAGRGPNMAFLAVPEPKSVKNRLHIDLTPPETMRAEVDRLRGLGATFFAEMRVEDAFWTVLRDPEGNEFCVLRGPVDLERQAAQAETAAADDGADEATDS